MTVLDWTELAGFAGASLAGAAYVPQITHLLRERCTAGISRSAFDVWLVASVLVTARAVAIHAGVFVFLGGIQVLATAMICVAARVFKDSYCESHQRSPHLLASGRLAGGCHERWPVVSSRGQ
jgi:hypothetical protein